MIFCGDQRWTAGLTSAGIDIVNLANNHSYNYGSAGLTATVEALTASNLKPIGLGQPAIITVNGTSFAFLGFNAIGGSRPPIAAAVTSDITSQVSAAQQLADVVVVQFHWGQEYKSTPSPDQRRLAHLAIDSGADLVLGHHPHWVQPVEIYAGVPIIYSLGNFVFDQYWSEATRQGLVVRATFQKHRLADIRLIPIIIDMSGRPSVAPSPVSDSILSRLRAASVE
jgi:poly-gamma-glutamate synthesis protein (capsule biosynthesis protein)